MKLLCKNKNKNISLFLKYDIRHKFIFLKIAIDIV